MNENIDFTHSGRIAVIIGNGGFVREYETHPQVTFLDSKNYKTFQELNGVMPVDTKLVVITDGIPQHLYLWITNTYCRNKKIVFLVRKSNNAIYETLKKYLSTNGGPKASPEEVKEAFVKGKLEPLVQYIDWSKSNTENGRILWAKSVELGIKTTEGSLVQLVSIRRRKQSAGTVPKSARSQLDITIDNLEALISGLSEIKEFCVQVTEENRIMKSKIERLEKIFKGDV